MPTLKQLAKAAGLNPSTVYERRRRGVPDDALFAPVQRLRDRTNYTQHPEYNVWRNLKRRCNFDPINPPYLDPAWESFPAFLADVGPRPSPDHCLRLHNRPTYRDNHYTYNKHTCGWVPKKKPKPVITGRLDWLLIATPPED